MRASQQMLRQCIAGAARKLLVFLSASSPRTAFACARRLPIRLSGYLLPDIKQANSKS